MTKRRTRSSTNLKISKSATGIKYQSLPESIQVFLEIFPEGFYGQKFQRHEREYKDKAHALAQSPLDKDVLTSLMDDGNHGEAAYRASKVVNCLKKNRVPDSAH